MGDILEKDRAAEELFNLELEEKELYMLAALTEADVSAISTYWLFGISDRLEPLIERALEEGEND